MTSRTARTRVDKDANYEASAPAPALVSIEEGDEWEDGVWKKLGEVSTQR